MKRTGRIDTQSLFDDPGQSRELMIRMLIAAQGRDGVRITWDEAAAAYDRLQDELRAGRAVSNPGSPVSPVSKEALATFKRFHSRKADEPVYPFHRNDESVICLERLDWPEEAFLLGEAMRTLYESDKWHKPGETTQYFHDHDPGRVRFLVPGLEARQYGGLESAEMPCGWPEEVTLIGECIGFVVRPVDTGKVTEGIMKGRNILVCSPDGWLDPRQPQRVFLAIINMQGKGRVEAVIEGGNLRITAHGIEG
jgi:hypothetical protein